MASTYQQKVAARNRHVGRSKDQPVAGNAVAGEPNRKQKARLGARRKAYDASKGTSAGGHRMHRPGSMQ